MTTDTTRETTTQRGPLPAAAHVHLNGHADLGACWIDAALMDATVPGPTRPGVFMYIAENIETGARTIFPPAALYRMDALSDADVEKLQRDLARRVAIQARLRDAFETAARAARAKGPVLVTPASQGPWAVRVQFQHAHVRGETEEVLERDFTAALQSVAPEITGMVERVGYGGALVAIGAGDEPIVAAVEGALRAMGFEDVRHLETTFDLFASSDIPF